MGTHKKRLGEALLMSTHNIRFHGEIRFESMYKYLKKRAKIRMNECIYLFKSTTSR